jgi:hypothetical protein
VERYFFLRAPFLAGRLAADLFLAAGLPLLPAFFALAFFLGATLRAAFLATFGFAFTAFFGLLGALAGAGLAGASSCVQRYWPVGIPSTTLASHDRSAPWFLHSS